MTRDSEIDGRPGRSNVTLSRVSDAPVVEAGSVPGYGPIFNAGVILEDDVFHLFARGVRDGYSVNLGPGPRFHNYISDILVFTSSDGRAFDYQQVLARSSPTGVHCYEDPRVQRVRSGDCVETVMTYTNLPAPSSGRPWRIGTHRLGYDNGRFFLNRTSGRVIGPSGEPNKDAVIFNLRDGRVALLHRIHPNIQLALFDSLDELRTADDDYWDKHMQELDHHTIIRASNGALGIGAGAPPVEIDGELIFFYHERDSTGRYIARVALLDGDTGRVKAELSDPVMQPELTWERDGDVNDVVFVQGAVARSDGSIYVTYGAADRCVGAATVSAADVLDACRSAA